MMWGKGRLLHKTSSYLSTKLLRYSNVDTTTTFQDLSNLLQGPSALVCVVHMGYLLFSLETDMYKARRINVFNLFSPNFLMKTTKFRLNPAFEESGRETEISGVK